MGSVLQDREEDGSVRMAAAQGFSIIVEDSPVCLNKAHHAVIRPLFKQRFFHSMLTPLMEAMQKASAADVELSRLWLYRGLAHLVSGIPHSVVLTDGEKVSIHHIYPSLLFCVLLVYGIFNFNPIFKKSLSRFFFRLEGSKVEVILTFQEGCWLVGVLGSFFFSVPTGFSTAVGWYLNSLHY